MFFDISYIFAEIQRLKIRRSKEDDKRSRNSVRVECWRVDCCRLLLMYMYISQFDIYNKDCHFSLLIFVEFKHPSYKNKMICEKCMNLRLTFNSNTFYSIVLFFFFIYFILSSNSAFYFLRFLSNYSTFKH